MEVEVINATNARKNLFSIMDEVSDTHIPYIITGKRNDAVLVSKQDWDDLQETLYLYSIPGMVEKIKEGINTPLEECVEFNDW